MNQESKVQSHNVYTFDDVTISSNFDNGNIGKCEKVPNKSYEYRIWTAPDNMGTPFQSKHCAWFHFSITGLPMGCVLRIQIVNTSNHSGLYKHDMRPVYRCQSTNQKWVRIKSSVRFSKESDGPQLYFEHSIDSANETYFFSFTYPYTFTMLQNELGAYDMAHSNDFSVPGSLFYQRELLTESLDKRRIDLITISSVDGCGDVQAATGGGGGGSSDSASSNGSSSKASKASSSSQQPQSRSSSSEDLYAPLFSGLFPETNKPECRPPNFPKKEVVFISARVHPGEVPAQHTFKGILDLLMDPNDLRAKELRARYVFKLIPMLNPDGVYRGHFRMDQLGHNLNRYYTTPDPLTQPAIFAAKTIIDHYAGCGRLAFYLDFHAHASKRGCFIYGNVLDTAEDQIQNQLFCKLISMNSAHFDYEGCLFSKEHMTRIDPGDAAKGLTAEGSGRVATYLNHKLIHSYTIECNYNTSRVGNEIAPPDNDPHGSNVTPSSPFTTCPEKYTPATWAGVGRGCIVAILDIRGHNPCSRIPKSKFKTLERVRNAVGMEVRSRKEYFGHAINRERRRSVAQIQQQKHQRSSSAGGSRNTAGGSNDSADSLIWRRVVATTDEADAGGTSEKSVGGGSIASGASNGTGSNSARGKPVWGSSQSERVRSSTGGGTATGGGGSGGTALFISAKGGNSARRRSTSGVTKPSSLVAGAPPPAPRANSKSNGCDSGSDTNDPYQATTTTGAAGACAGGIASSSRPKRSGSESERSGTSEGVGIALAPAPIESRSSHGCSDDSYSRAGGAGEAGLDDLTSTAAPEALSSLMSSASGKPTRHKQVTSPQRASKQLQQQHQQEQELRKQTMYQGEMSSSSSSVEGFRDGEGAGSGTDLSAVAGSKSCTSTTATRHTAFVSRLPVKNAAKAASRSPTDTVSSAGSIGSGTGIGGVGGVGIGGVGVGGAGSMDNRRILGKKLSAAGVALLMDARLPQQQQSQQMQQQQYPSDSSRQSGGAGAGVDEAIGGMEAITVAGGKLHYRSHSTQRSTTIISGAAGAVGIDALINSSGPHFCPAAADLEGHDGGGSASVGGSRCGSEAGSPTMMLLPQSDDDPSPNRQQQCQQYQQPHRYDNRDLFRSAAPAGAAGAAGGGSSGGSGGSGAGGFTRGKNRSPNGYNAGSGLDDASCRQQQARHGKVTSPPHPHPASSSSSSSPSFEQMIAAGGVGIAEAHPDVGGSAGNQGAVGAGAGAGTGAGADDETEQQLRPMHRAPKNMQKTGFLK